MNGVAVPRPWLRATLAVALLLAGYAGTVAVSFPGHYSYDSLAQLLEGRARAFGSIHPPLMSLLLAGATDTIGHGAYMAAVCALYYLAVGLVLFDHRHQASTGRLLAFAAVAVLNPVVFIYNGIVWKDVLFANLAILGFALAGRPGSRGRLVAALLLFGMASLVRQQGVLVALIGAAVVAHHAGPAGAPARAWLPRFLAAGAMVGVVMLVLAGLVSAVQTRGGTSTAVGVRVLATFDIAAILARAGERNAERLARAGVTADAAIAEARAGYSPQRIDGLVALAARLAPLDGAQVNTLWRSLVLAEPAIWLAHRARAWGQLVGPHGGNTCLPVHVGVPGTDVANAIAANTLGRGVAPGSLPTPAAASTSLYLYAMGARPLFSGWIWLLACLAALVLASVRRDRVVQAIAGAGCAFSASYFLVGIACDFRYQYFTVAAGLFSAGILWLVPRRRERAAGAPASREVDVEAMPAPAAPRQVFVSAVLVVRNQADTLVGTLAALGTQLDALATDYEIIIVDNASDDASAEVLGELTGADGLKNLQAFVLTKQVDFDVAAWAGVESAIGDLVVQIDPARDDPRALHAMLDCAGEGADVVFAVNRRGEGHGPIHSVLRGAFNRLYRWLGGVDLAREAPAYRLLNRRVVNFILQHPQPAITFRHLPASGGFVRSYVAYRSRRQVPRRRTLAESVDKGMRLIVSTTRAPMRLVTALTLFGAVANLAYSAYVIAVWIFKEDVAPGWVTLSLQQSGMFFLLSLVLLVLGEYILQMAALSNEGPAYHVAREFTSTRMTRRERLNVEVVQAGRGARADG